MKKRNFGCRILALLMVLVMTVGAFPLAAFAEGEMPLSFNIGTYVSAVNRQFNGQPADLLMVDTNNLPADVVLRYTCNGTTTTTVPQGFAIGEYDVRVDAYVNDVCVATQTFRATIGGNGISAVPLNQKYDGAAHPVVTVTGTQPGDVIEYGTGGGENWTATCPTMTDVGISTDVVVRVTRSGSQVFARYGMTAAIIQNDMLQLAYKQDGLLNYGVLEYPAGSTTIDLGVKYAYDNHPGDLTIVYGARAIKTVSRDNGTTDRGMTVDAETGVITLQKGDVPTEAGLYEVYARVKEPEGKNNYTEAAKTLSQFVVVFDTPTLTFAQEDLNYILGTTTGEGEQGVVNANVPGLIVTGQGEAATVIPNNSNPAYSIVCATQGSSYENSVSVDPDTGKFTVDPAMLNHIGNPQDGIIESYMVTAQMSASKYNFGTQNTEFTSIPVEIGERTVYAEANASYTLNILQSNLSGEDVTKAYQIQEAAINGWYGGNGASVTVKAETGFQLAKDGDAAYTDALSFSDDGDEHYLFIQNKDKGIVSGMTRLLDPQGNPVKIDSTVPEDFDVVYMKVSVLSIIQEVLSLGFQKSGVTVIISATDNGSGVAGIKIWAPGQKKPVSVTINGQSTALPQEEAQALEIPNSSQNKASFSVQMLMSASDISEGDIITDVLKATVADLAGNVKNGFDSQTVYAKSVSGSSGDHVTVIADGDNPVISMESTVAYDEGNFKLVGQVSTDIAEVPVTVTRFIPDVCKVDYTFRIQDDTLSHSETVVCVSDQDGNTVLSNQDVTWEGIENGKKGTLTISGDGEYLISITALDKAGNRTAYTHKLVLDTIPPVVEITANIQQEQMYQGVGYTNQDIVYTITVDDVHFNENRVSIFCEKDGSMFAGGILSSWTLNENGKNEATFTIRNNKGDGAYTLKVGASDGISDDFVCNTVEKTFGTPIVLDTVKPVVTLTYADGMNQEYYSFQPDGNGILRTATVKVDDANPAATIPAGQIISQCIIAKNIKEESVQNAVTADDSGWAADRELKLLFKAEANYQVNILEGELICDLAGNTAVLSGNYEEKFTLDKTAPNAPGEAAGTIAVSINISDANKGTGARGNWLERLVDGVAKLFGYWKDEIMVTVAAEDMVSGLQTASYTFKPSLGASRTGTVTLTQSGNDKKSFSGTFKLPGNVFDTENQQLNGTITVWLNDRCGNEAAMVDRGWHIVYDTINPEMTVRYETCVNEPENGDVIYFAAPATATVSILEENFEPDMLTVTNNETAVTNLSWAKSNREDGTLWNETSFVIGKSGENAVDGEYTITISGQDYAGNPLKVIGADSEDYRSKKLIVDTTDPVLGNPGVSSGNCVQTIDKVDYYKDTQGVHFTFDVLEKNFDPNAIHVLVQKNGVSAALNTDYTLAWAANGDLHTGHIHITKDGEYTIAISGEDLAENKLVAGENAVITDNQYQYAKTIVLDNTPPEISLKYEPMEGIQPGRTKDGKEYIPGKIKFTLKVTDNFLLLNAGASFQNPNGIYLRIEKTKDGVPSEEEISITTFDKDPTDYRGTDMEYTYTWEEQDDAEYKIEAFYTDFVKNAVSSQPEHIPVIDTTAPTLSVVYADGKQQQYYNLADLKTDDNENGYRKAVVTIQERNLDTDVVTGEYLLSDTFLKLTDVTGASVKEDNSVQIAKRPTMQGIDHVWDLVFAAEANYSFDLSVKEDDKTVIQDLAGNSLMLAEGVTSPETVFTIDRTAPGAESPSQEAQGTETGPGTLRVTYNIPKDDKKEEKWYTNLWEKIRFGFWKEMIEVTISCYEETAGLDTDTPVAYTFTKAERREKDGKWLLVSGSNADTFQGKVKFDQDQTDKKYFSAVVKLPKDVLKTVSEEGVLEETAQLNGTFSITLADLCNNQSKYDGKPKNADGEEIRLVYDTISPTREVTFGPVANTKDNKTYFAGDITGTVRVNEANFFIKDGKTDIINTGFETGWVSESADSHVGTFKITGEGEHTVTITGMDYAGNKMEDWKSEFLIIDTLITPPVITVNGEEADGKAFKDDVMLGISFFDDNFRDVKIQILRTRLDEKDVDVADVLAKTEEMDEEGGMISYDPLEKVKDNDGIYVVIVTMRDWANHESTSTATFSVNRFGSVYTYGDYLRSIIRDGGLYIRKVSEDLVIHEFNADRLVGDVNIQITRDGKPLEKVIYTSNAMKNDIAVGNSGWYEYTHVISKDNFLEDGLYKISISSQDFAGNHPENINMDGMFIQFYVDSTSPELTSVTGLEKAIVNAEAVDVKFVAYDTVGLKSVNVYLDGDLVEEVTEFPDRNNHNGGLTLNESDKVRVVRIVLEDLAGNILDTGSEDFESAYVMVQGITVSTNFWVRFLADKPLLYGCIGVLVVTAGGVGIGVPTAIAIKKKGRYAKRK